MWNSTRATKRTERLARPPLQFYWKPHFESSTVGEFRFDFEPSSITLREGVHDRYTETGTGIAFRCEKRLEDPAPNLGSKARPVVSHFNPGTAIVSAGRHRDFSFFLKRVRGVDKEIHNRRHAI